MDGSLFPSTNENVKELQTYLLALPRTPENEKCFSSKINELRLAFIEIAALISKANSWNQNSPRNFSWPHSAMAEIFALHHESLGRVIISGL